MPRSRAALFLPLMLLALLLVPGVPESSVDAFELPVHEQIVLDALSGKMSQDALVDVIEGNKRSDLHQFAPERHFDSAPDRAALCERQQQGLSAFFAEAIRLSAPKADWKQELEDREDALEGFGAVTHAIADFYAHTNWVELRVEGRVQGPAPILGTDCTAEDFPEELQSGFFSLGSGLDGCPVEDGQLLPPAGFRYCHAQIAKDHPDSGHGAERTAEDGPTYHELAVLLARVSTTAAWDDLRQRIISTYDDENTDGECVFRKLAWGGDESCLKRIRAEVYGSLGIGSGSYQTDWTITGNVVLEPRGDGLLSGTAPVDFVMTVNGICVGGGSYPRMTVRLDAERPKESNEVRLTAVTIMPDGIADVTAQVTCNMSETTVSVQCSGTAGQSIGCQSSAGGAATAPLPVPAGGLGWLDAPLTVKLGPGASFTVPRPALYPSEVRWGMLINLMPPDR